MAVYTEGVRETETADDELGWVLSPQAIVDALSRQMQMKQDLAGKTVLITAGPTQEPIDPVRYIANRSSGKQGLALASEAMATLNRIRLRSFRGSPAWPASQRTGPPGTA